MNRILFSSTLALFVFHPMMASAEDVMVNPWEYPMGMNVPQKVEKVTPVVQEERQIVSDAPSSEGLIAEESTDVFEEVQVDTDTQEPEVSRRTEDTAVGNYEIIPGYVGTNLKYSKTMFDRQEYVTDKAVQQLKARQRGDLDDNKLGSRPSSF